MASTKRQGTGKVIHRPCDLIDAEIDELAAIESLDNGKPVKDARHVDLPLAVECLRTMLGGQIN